MKRLVSSVLVSAFAVSVLTACGGQSLPVMPVVENTNQVQAESFLGVLKEVKNSSMLAFKELDKNADKMIAPDEYGVGTPDSAKAFYALDDNHDGKITLKEMMPGFFKRLGLTFRIQSAAKGLFKQIDKDSSKGVVKEELTSGLVSAAFTAEFDKYDTEKPSIFNKNPKGKLSKSEFENLFAHIALNNIKNTNLSDAPAAPTPDGADAQ